MQQDKDWSYEKQLALELHNLLEMVDEDETPLLYCVRPDTYESVGMATYNQGLVLRLADGAEYQLTLVCSKNPEVVRCHTCMKILDQDSMTCQHEDCKAYNKPLCAECGGTEGLSENQGDCARCRED